MLKCRMLVASTIQASFSVNINGLEINLDNIKPNKTIFYKQKITLKNQTDTSKAIFKEKEINISVSNNRKYYGLASVDIYKYPGSFSRGVDNPTFGIYNRNGKLLFKFPNHKKIIILIRF